MTHRKAAIKTCTCQQNRSFGSERDELRRVGSERNEWRRVGPERDELGRVGSEGDEWRRLDRKEMNCVGSDGKERVGKDWVEEG